jgi:hypothetical protein
MPLSPSIAPRDEDAYLVEGDLGQLGTVWREADSEGANLEVVLSDLMAGQYKKPLRVIAFNVAEGWSRDASEEVAQILRRRSPDLPESLSDFLELHLGQAAHQLALPLAFLAA